MTHLEAAEIAKRKFAAPPDLERYVWYRGTRPDKPVWIPGTSRLIPLLHTELTVEGELKIGWNEFWQEVAFTWEPAP